MHRLVCYQKRTYGSAYQLGAVENHGLVSPAAWKVTDGNERLVLQLLGPGKSFSTLRAFQLTISAEAPTQIEMTANSATSTDIVH